MKTIFLSAAYLSFLKINFFPLFQFTDFCLMFSFFTLIFKLHFLLAFYFCFSSDFFTFSCFVVLFFMFFFSAIADMLSRGGGAIFQYIPSPVSDRHPDWKLCRGYPTPEVLRFTAISEKRFSDARSLLPISDKTRYRHACLFWYRTDP